MIVAVSCILALASGAGDVVATVDGKTVTRADVRERSSELRGRDMPAAAEDAAESLILELLLSGEARRSGLAEAPAVRARIAREVRRAATAAMLEQEVETFKPSDDELRRLYHATADSVRIKTLVFPSEDAARVNLALAQRSGSFDDAARSAVPGFAGPESASPRIRGQLPAPLAELVFSLPVGGFGGPIELAAGWGIVKVLERTLGDDAGFAAQRDSIARFARQQAAEAARTHLKDQLRRGAKITVDDAFLESLGKRMDATPAERDHVVATVDGEQIRYREVEASIRSLSAGSGHLGGPTIRKRLVMNEVEDRLVEKAAERRGLPSSPKVTARVPSIERRVLATAVVDKARESASRPSEKELRAFYKSNVSATGQSFESTRASILGHLVESKRNEALEKMHRELRSRAAITIDREALRSALAP